VSGWALEWGDVELWEGRVAGKFFLLHDVVNGALTCYRRKKWTARSSWATGISVAKRLMCASTATFGVRYEGACGRGFDVGLTCSKTTNFHGHGLNMCVFDDEQFRTLDYDDIWIAAHTYRTKFHFKLSPTFPSRAGMTTTLKLATVLRHK
jgi:hypothetical protein